MQALLETHDLVADNKRPSHRKNSHSTPNRLGAHLNGHSNSGGHDNAVFMPEELNLNVDTVRMVGLRKKPDEPLGLTVREDESGYLIIARIMAGGSIDRQGLLHVGDAVCEVNGVEVKHKILSFITYFFI